MHEKLLSTAKHVRNRTSKRSKALSLQLCSLPESCPSNFVVELAKFPTTTKENKVEINFDSLEGKKESMNCFHSKDKKLNLKFFVEQNGKEKRPVLRDLGCTLVASLTEAEAIWLERWDACLGKVFGVMHESTASEGKNTYFIANCSVPMFKRCGVACLGFQSHMTCQPIYQLCVLIYYFSGISSYWILRAADPSTLGLRPIVTSDLRRVIRCTEVGHLVASQCK